MSAEFDLADKLFTETRTNNRIEAITKAKAKLKHLERQIAVVKADIEKAKNGDFLALIEKYISLQAAEEFE